MSKPNVYEFGSYPEILLAFTDTEGIPFVPPIVSLSIREPDGVLITVSGSDMTVLSGSIMSYIYQPRLIGWHEYYGLGNDNAGREIVRTNGFEVITQVL